MREIVFRTQIDENTGIVCGYRRDGRVPHYITETCARDSFSDRTECLSKLRFLTRNFNGCVGVGRGEWGGWRILWRDANCLSV